MSFKIPCGGFKLDENSFSLDENGVLSIPKPLTYDYMPEGYPSKSVGTVTLMEEQEVTFSDVDGVFTASSPVALDIKLGDKPTVVWDGVSYNVTVKAPEMGPSGALAFGNLGLTGLGDTEDYPFVYTMSGSMAQWATADTATSHTIKVMRQQLTITPMSTDFISKNLNVVISVDTSGDTNVYSCNVTYDELRGWVDRYIPVVVYIEYTDEKDLYIITSIKVYSNYLRLGYMDTSGGVYNIVYNSDGSISHASAAG